MRKQILLCILLGLSVLLLSGCRAKRLPGGVGVQSLRYETRGMAMGSETLFSIFKEGEGFVIVRSDGWGQPERRMYADADTGRKSADILRKYNVLSWDGFSGHDPHILDGTSFSLEIVFDDGTVISARGTNSWPKGMGQALREIEDLFDQLPREPEQ